MVSISTNTFLPSSYKKKRGRNLTLDERVSPFADAVLTFRTQTKNGRHRAIVKERGGAYWAYIQHNKSHKPHVGVTRVLLPRKMTLAMLHSLITQGYYP